TRPWTRVSGTPSMAVSESLDVPLRAAPAAPVQRQAPSPWVAARRRFLRSRTGLAGALVLILVTAAAIFATQIAPYNPTRQDFRVQHQAPSATHLMGTDEFGRDVLSRVIYGAQSSLQAGALAASIALVIGVVLDMFAAYYG